jgi:hypothetical protein
VWATLLLGYATLIATLIAYAAHVALSNKDRQRRADAFRVLRLLSGITTGAGGILAVLIKLHESGVV